MTFGALVSCSSITWCRRNSSFDTIIASSTWTVRCAITSSCTIMTSFAFYWNSRSCWAIGALRAVCLGCWSLLTIFTLCALAICNCRARCCKSMTCWNLYTFTDWSSINWSGIWARYASLNIIVKVTIFQWIIITVGKSGWWTKEASRASQASALSFIRLIFTIRCAVCLSCTTIAFFIGGTYSSNWVWNTSRLARTIVSSWAISCKSNRCSILTIFTSWAI